MNDLALKGTQYEYPTKSTSYTATAYGLEGYKGQPATKTVTVYSLPQIIEFTGEIPKSNSAEVSLVLSWEVQGVTECTISGIPETTVGATGQKTVTPSVKYPLQSTYTLTASNQAGKAKSQLTVVWGRKTELGHQSVHRRVLQYRPMAPLYLWLTPRVIRFLYSMPQRSNQPERILPKGLSMWKSNLWGCSITNNRSCTLWIACLRHQY